MFYLTSVALDVGAGGSGQLDVSIHAASGGNPGDQIGSNLRGAISSTAGQTTYTVNNRVAFIILNGATTYFVRVRGSGSTASRTVGTTASNAQTGTAGWAVADTGREYSGTSWSGLSAGRSLRVTVNAQLRSTAPVFDTTAFRVKENSKWVGTVRFHEHELIDFDPTRSLNLVGGKDQAKVGQHYSRGSYWLYFKVVPDFENPHDANRDNTYEIVMRVTTGLGWRQRTTEQTFTITVTDDPNDAPTANASPVFASINPEFTVAENQTSAGTIVATDADPQDSSVTYSLESDWQDGGLFSINSTTGALSFRTAPDYENPRDRLRLNWYAVNVLAHSGTGVRRLSTNQMVLVTHRRGRPERHDRVAGRGPEPGGRRFAGDGDRHPVVGPGQRRDRPADVDRRHVGGNRPRCAYVRHHRRRQHHRHGLDRHPRRYGRGRRDLHSGAGHGQPAVLGGGGQPGL